MSKKVNIRGTVVPLQKWLPAIDVQHILNYEHMCDIDDIKCVPIYCRGSNGYFFIEKNSMARNKIYVTAPKTMVRKIVGLAGHNITTTAADYNIRGKIVIVPEI